MTEGTQVQGRQKYLVCCALPYANGPLHIGHLAGAYLPGDIYARFRRMQGHDVQFVCGSDEYGVAITVRAVQEGTTPQAIVDKYHALLEADMKSCKISLDVYSRTTHPCHTKRSQEIFTNLLNNGLIETRTEKRLFCETDQQFLPDRYVAGTCPKCNKPGARGDQCEKCGTWFEPEDLLEPVCQICKKTTPVLRETKHWYICLNKLESKLQSWLESKTHWRKTVLGYAFQPIKAELSPRSITRDISWGIPVPLEEAAGKVLYVWFDAPIGYISASEDLSLRQGEPDLWKRYWEDKDTRLIHFIGKDNIIFHSVVWPAVLMGDGRYVLPDLVAGNEFLNLEGDKISTSRNFAIWVADAVKLVDVDLLRYYLTRISPETSDSNFTWEEFQQRVNSELADVLGNLANRSLSFIAKNYGGAFPIDGQCDGDVVEKIKDTYSSYSAALEGGFSRGSSDSVVELGRYLNGYFQERAPWKLRKEDPALAHQVLYSVAVGLCAVAKLLFPICPGVAERIYQQLGFSQSPAEAGFVGEWWNVPVSQKLSAEVAPIVGKIEDAFVQERLAEIAEMRTRVGIGG